MRRYLGLLLLLGIPFWEGCKNDDSTGSESSPTISEMRPAQFSRGQQGVSARIIGTNFTGIVAVDLGDGIEIKKTTILNATKLEVRFSVRPDAVPGPRTISVTTAGGTVRNAVLTIMDNHLPSARFSVSPARGARNVPFTFDASNSVDPDGSIQAYDWEFGDGATGSGQVVTHKYTTAGTFLVKLTVTDNAQGKGTATGNVVVDDNQPPVARFSISPRSGGLTTLFTFDGAESEDPDGSIREYRWEFGDGARAQGRRVTHKYAQKGTFLSKLTVKDNDGSEGIKEKEVSVAGSPPIASFTVSPDSGPSSTRFEFDGSGSTDPDGTIVGWVWNFDDGTSVSGRVVRHRFSTNGRYAVQMTATDNDGLRDTVTRNVTVEDPGGGGGGGGGTAGRVCTQPARRGPQLYGTVLSADRSSDTMVIRLDEPANCETAFYRCGDVRKGGDPQPPELWYGVICGMKELGNNTFEVTTRLGKYWPSPGEEDVYLWWVSCDKEPVCNK